MNVKLWKFNFEIKKSYLIILLIVLVALIATMFISSNKSKTLTCTTHISRYTSEGTETYVATFKKDKLTKLVITYRMTPYGDYYKTVDELYSDYDSELAKLKSAGGYDYTITKGTDYVQYTSTIITNKIPATTIDTIGFSKEWNLKDFQENLEKYKFTCK